MEAHSTPSGRREERHPEQSQGFPQKSVLDNGTIQGQGSRSQNSEFLALAMPQNDLGALNNTEPHPQGIPKMGTIVQSMDRVFSGGKTKNSRYQSLATAIVSKMPLLCLSDGRSW